MRHHQLPCVKQLAGDAAALLEEPVESGISVFVVAADGMADGGQMGPDLMAAPGQKLHLKKGHACSVSQRLIFGGNRQAVLHRT